MDSVKYVGLDVHQATISVVANGQGRLLMRSVVATKASAIVELIGGLRGTVHVTFEEGTHSNLKEKVADMECLPDSLRGRQYYRPTSQGMEQRIQEILERIKAAKKS